MVPIKSTAYDVQPATKTTVHHEWASIAWVFASATAIATIRPLLASADVTMADNLLLLHLLPAFILQLISYGPSNFVYAAVGSMISLMNPVGFQALGATKVWLNWLYRVLYVALSTTNLVCGYRALACFQNLPIAIMFMQMGEVPLDLFNAILAFTWTRSAPFGPEKTHWRDDSWLVLQICGTIGLFWFCWRYWSTHIVGVLLAVVSSVAAIGATILHYWIADDVRTGKVDESELSGLDTLVLALNSMIILALVMNRNTNVSTALEFCARSPVLMLLNILSGAAAMYLNGGSFRHLRTRADYGPHYIAVPISMAWCITLLIFEIAATGSLGMMIPETLVYVIVMIGKPPIEGSLEALAVIWVRRRG